jgi:hypothetical protein
MLPPGFNHEYPANISTLGGVDLSSWPSAAEHHIAIKIANTAPARPTRLEQPLTESDIPFLPTFFLLFLVALFDQKPGNGSATKNFVTLPPETPRSANTEQNSNATRARRVVISRRFLKELLYDTQH